jgi:hypothetical protein
VDKPKKKALLFPTNPFIHDAMTDVYHMDGRTVGRLCCPPPYAVVYIYAKSRGCWDRYAAGRDYAHLLEIDGCLVRCGEFFTFMRKWERGGKLLTIRELLKRSGQCG